MVTTQTQFRRGTTAQIAVATGAQGEIWYATDTFHLYTNDGTTQGGYLLPLYSDLPTNYVTSGLLQSTGQTLYTYLINTLEKIKTSNFSMDCC